MKTFSEKEIGIVANAIGWVFFGEASEDGQVVEVDSKDSDKCVEAAKRALASLEQYRQRDI